MLLLYDVSQEIVKHLILLMRLGQNSDAMLRQKRRCVSVARGPSAISYCTAFCDRRRATAEEEIWGGRCSGHGVKGDGGVVDEPMGSNSNIHSLTFEGRSEIGFVPPLCSFPG